MNIILDSNILFAALIRESTTRKLILWHDGYFLIPSYIFIEMESHKAELLAKSGLDKPNFDWLLRLLLNKVIIIPNNTLQPYRKQADHLVKDIDLGDALFVAAALAYSGSVLWSDDKKLKRIDGINVINTSEMIRILEE